MSELTSKSEVSTSIESEASSRRIDPDCRVAEKSVDAGLSSIDNDTHLIDPDVRVGGRLSFNGFRNAERIADIQSGRNCSYEAMENLAQLQIGDKDGLLNDLSDKFHEFVKTHPERFDARDRGWWGFWHNDRWYVDMAKYPEILKQVGVETKAMPFSHSELQRALSENRAVIIGGDVVHLPQYRGQVGGHALVAVDWTPNNGGRYTLLDSNFKNTYSVSADEIEKFCKSTEAFEGGISMIVAEKPSSWPWKTYAEDPRTLEVFSDYERFLGRVNDEICKRQVKGVSFKGRIENVGNGETEGSRDLLNRLKGMFESIAGSVRKYIKQSREESSEEFAKRISGMDTESLVKEAGKLGKRIHDAYEEAGGAKGEALRRAKHYEKIKQDFKYSMELFMQRVFSSDPETLRAMSNRIQNEREALREERHLQEIQHQMYELERAKIQKMSPDQYRAASEHGLTKLNPDESTAFSDRYGYLYKVGFDGTVERVFVNGTPARA